MKFINSIFFLAFFFTNTCFSSVYSPQSIGIVSQRMYTNLLKQVDTFNGIKRNMNLRKGASFLLQRSNEMSFETTMIAQLEASNAFIDSLISEKLITVRSKTRVQNLVSTIEFILDEIVDSQSFSPDNGEVLLTIANQLKKLIEGSLSQLNEEKKERFQYLLYEFQELVTISFENHLKSVKTQEAGGVKIDSFYFPGLSSRDCENFSNSFDVLYSHKLKDVMHRTLKNSVTELELAVDFQEYLSESEWLETAPRVILSRIL